MCTSRLFRVHRDLDAWHESNAVLLRRGFTRIEARHRVVIGHRERGYAAFAAMPICSCGGCWPSLAVVCECRSIMLMV